MASVLVVGIDPDAVPGLDGPGLRAALDAELARFTAHGIDAAMTLLPLDETAEPALGAALTSRPWDVVVIGGGIRKPAALLELFESVVNQVRRLAPQAAIAFNSTGGDSVEAALRHLPDEGQERGPSGRWLT
ncbi:MAG TPA: hypothetical protein VLM05_11255 [Mycobacteriales bacterium]|nr:hypothetical protein [Mycobacteriales bacterium]